MRSRMMAISIIAALAGGVASAEVSVHYSPTQVDPGVATPITISIQDETGNGLEIVGIVLDFIVPEGVTLDGFSWLSGFDEEPTWLATVAFPKVETASFGAGRAVPASGRLDIGILTLTAAAETAGRLLTLHVLPEPSDAMIVNIEGLRSLEIVGGRSVELSVSGSADDGGEGTDPGTGSEAPTETPPDDSQVPTGGQPTEPTSDEGADDDADTVGGPSPTSPCGIATVPFLLFTLTLLSAMKLDNRRRAP